NAEDVNCQIYPNPASEIMFIEVSENAELRMYSLDGRLILAETLAEGNNQIEINNVGKGTYVVYVQGVSSKAVFKQVIY
ncbi:MAG: T9SS type A sorting domain-containing protein, partial [Paludibacteraceae bacterium]|nr:T9SS type A sorting domain-containing protein [Paludibacteraceae bacterium]